ncbi:uncharacterized protein TNCV_4968421 [Trichonephila clavipes]|nr:uncharacterized protein TNCV_4968421 [Trichonephila clavipes]
MVVRKTILHLRAGTPSIIQGVRDDHLYPKSMEGQSVLKHPKESLCCLFLHTVPVYPLGAWGGRSGGKDKAPPHWSLKEHSYLNQELPQRWMGLANDGDFPLITWPPKFPDLTPCDLFLWGYVRATVYVPSMLKTLQNLKNAFVQRYEISKG